MELFTTCPRQAFYYIIRKLELNRDKIALDFGSAFHTVLEYLYKTHGTGYRSAEQNQDVINFTSRTITHRLSPEEEQFRKAAHERGELLSPVLVTPEDDYRTVSYLLEGVQRYLTQYPAEAYEIAKLPDGSPAIEMPFAMPIGTIQTTLWGPVTVMWTGKMDKVYRSRGNLGLQDHKTTSMMGPSYFSEFEIAHQMYGYANAVEYVFKEPCHEILINALGCRKPTVKGKGEKFEFARHIIPINRDLLDEWFTDSLALVSDFLSHCERGYFPKATKWCVAKYGACQYRQVCSLSPENRDLALSTNEFKKVTWSPLTAKP